MQVPTRKTIGELLEAMLVESYNVARDKLLSLVGGPPSVTARLRAIGLDGITIERTEAELARGFPDNTATPEAGVFRNRLRAALDHLEEPDPFTG